MTSLSVLEVYEKKHVLYCKSRALVLGQIQSLQRRTKESFWEVCYALENVKILGTDKCILKSEKLQK